MTARNPYATLAEWKAFTIASGQTITTDTADDAVVDGLLEAASRYIDGKTSRRFYPRIETRSYSIPVGSELSLEADLLAVITLLNGDNTSIAASAYNLLPKNDTPKYGLKLLGSTSVVWESDSNNDTEYVIDLTGIFGFHNRYTDGWKIGSTLAEVLDTSELGFDMTSGTLFSAGQILKIDNEICLAASVATNTVTVIERGANGSTAATHDNGATVYYWQPMEDARNAVLEIVVNAYKRRFGKSAGGNETVTAAGVVITPRDIPAMAAEFITTYRRIV